MPIIHFEKIIKIKNLHCFSDDPPNIELIENEDGELLISIPIHEAPQEIPEYYGFSKGRHSGSFFLKIGGAIFCAMHIVHLTLLIAKEVSIIR